jgi:hypothetical protein
MVQIYLRYYLLTTKGDTIALPNNKHYLVEIIVSSYCFLSTTLYLYIDFYILV